MSRTAYGICGKVLFLLTFIIVIHFTHIEKAVKFTENNFK